MTSFHLRTDDRSEAVARLLSDVQDCLLNALLSEREKSGLTQQKLAERIGVHRSVINRELSGTANLTLRRVAELAWALNREATISLSEPDDHRANWQRPENREVKSGSLTDNASSNISARKADGGVTHNSTIFVR